MREVIERTPALDDLHEMGRGYGNYGSVLQICGLSKRPVKGHTGRKQQAADRFGGLPEDASGLGRRQFTKGDEDNDLALALGKPPDRGHQIGIAPGLGGQRWHRRRVRRPAALPLAPGRPVAVPGDPEHPSSRVRMHRDRSPVREGAGKGLRGRILSRGPVQGAGEQGPKHGAAVVLVEQHERLRRVHGHAAPPPLDRLVLPAAGEFAALCSRR